MKEIFVCVVMMCMFVIVACGIEDMPEPVKRRVAAEEIVGVWDNNERNHEEQQHLTLVLAENGTFTVTGSVQRDGTGAWELQPDNAIRLVYSSRSVVNSSWYLSESTFGELVIIGGDVGQVDHLPKLHKVD